DSEAQVIVAHAVTNQPPDAEHLAPMLDRIAENCGRLPRNLSADAGYFSAENVALAEALGLTHTSPPAVNDKRKSSHDHAAGHEATRHLRSRWLGSSPLRRAAPSTGGGRPSWSHPSVRSNRGEAFGPFCSAASRRCKASGP